MELKIILYVLIIVGSGVYGILKAASVTEKNNELMKFINAFEKMKIELEYRRSTLPDICTRIEHPFFKNIYQVYRENERITFGEAWYKAANISYMPGTITEEAYMLIKNIGNELGTSDIFGQSRIIELYLNELNKLYSESENECASKCKLYTSIGFAAGITIVILLA